MAASPRISRIDSFTLLKKAVKIGIVTQSHLCRNPRVVKEALSLAALGYEVAVFTSIYDKRLYEEDCRLIREYENISLNVLSDLSRRSIPSVVDKLLYKIGRFLVRYLKVETVLALGYGTWRYCKAPVDFNADLYICHQELATYTGLSLIKRGFRVAFDFEDWYSEDLLPAARRERPLRLLRRCESAGLRQGEFCFTTSHALAEKLASVYRCPLPKVIYNVFPFEKEVLQTTKKFNKPLKLLWFSQTIGSGRGIEHFMQLLATINEPLEFHLLGMVEAAYRQSLTILMPAQHSLFFHALVTTSNLPQKLAGFDIGLALESDLMHSRDLTITNKFFQYLQSGLPIIATRTAGQVEGFAFFNPGFLISQSPDETEKIALKKWLKDRDALAAARDRAVKAARYYCWQNESKKLQDMVFDVIEHVG